MPDQLVAVYSRRDLNRVRTLRRQLGDAGYLLWVDVDALTPGDSWPQLYADELARSAAALLIHSWEWIYDPRFLASELPFVLRAARTAGTCPPIVGVRVDDAPVPAPLRSLSWTGWYDALAAPELVSTLRRGGHADAADALGALETVVGRHDEAVRRLRMFIRQSWGVSIDLDRRRAYAEVVELWRPFFDTPEFRPDHPCWADDESGRCAVHGVRSLLFRACVVLGQSDFDYAPLAFAALRDVVTLPPFQAVDDDQTDLDAEAAETQNLNYADTLALAVQWSNGWSPEVLAMFGIPMGESTAVFQRVRERLVQLRAAGATG